MENYGAWGPEALKAFSQVASRLAIRGYTPKSKVVAELYGVLVGGESMGFEASGQ